MAVFEKALRKIGDGIADVSELNVRTFTGNISSPAAGQTTEDYMTAAFSSGELTVIGLTRIKLDGDADQLFVQDKDLRDALLPAHQEAIRAGQASRQAAFNLFSSKMSALINGLNLTDDA